MLQLLPHFSQIWKEEPKKVDKIGHAIIDNLKKAQATQPGGDLNATHLDRCFESLSVAYDPVHGGFGQEPKFPTPHALSFLLRYYQRTGEERALTMVTHTLRKIRLSGTYDQIGWGIHRYSTDSEWLLPHFEKMLYDQALFSIACLETFQITKNSFFNRLARTHWRMLTASYPRPQGAFTQQKMLTVREKKESFIYGTSMRLLQFWERRMQIFSSKYTSVKLREIILTNPLVKKPDQISPTLLRLFLNLPNRTVRIPGNYLLEWKKFGPNYLNTGKKGCIPNLMTRY